METFADRLAAVRAKIAQAAARVGRRSEEVALVAVSKVHPPEAVAAALDAGQILFGENRVQEARAKIPLLPARTRWHLIGHLQANKIRQALPLFEMIHSVDSVELARDINRVATDLGLRPRILLEVNVAGEGTKFGFTPMKLREGMEGLLGLGRLQIEGLMAIPPLAPEPEQSRPHFATLRELRDRIERELHATLPELSMGMSGDYPIAIEEGATLIRLGTALFGPRRGKSWRPEVAPGTFED